MMKIRDMVKDISTVVIATIYTMTMSEGNKKNRRQKPDRKWANM